MSLYFWGVFILFVILFVFSLLDGTVNSVSVIILSFTSWFGLFLLCVVIIDKWLEYLESYIFEEFIIDKIWYLH